MNGRSQDVLEQIVTRMRLKVSERRQTLPLDKLLARPQTRRPRRGFSEALVDGAGPHVIAEFKRRSPSRGLIREDLGLVHVVDAYQQGGAKALSILTEPEWFGGSIEDLKQARAVTRVPVLRKDFIVDEYQVWESWQAEADAILLIVAALPGAQLRDLLKIAQEAQLEALVEVHSESELKRALDSGAQIVGVNNRDLRTLHVDLKTSESLAALIPDDIVAVAESGIKTGDDVRRLRSAGFDGFLIGEHLMSAPSPGEALAELLEASRA
jgi:indole-3-glycerol phosphate synthase